MTMMTPDMIKETDYFLWNNFNGMFTMTPYTYEGTFMTLQDAIYLMIDKYMKPGSVLVTMYPVVKLKRGGGTAHVIVEK